MPFDFCCDDLFAHLGEFTAQNFREALSLGTLRRRRHGCGTGVGPLAR
jgi:hypothetical protein